MTADYLLPTIVQEPTTGLRCCGCDMCYCEETSTMRQATGPHDLHCLCFSCLSNPLSDQQNYGAFTQRYPEYFQLPENQDSDIFDLTDQQIQRILEDLDTLDSDGYEPPSISPTNQQMHAQNGNHGHEGLEMVNPPVTTQYDHKYLGSNLLPWNWSKNLKQTHHNLSHEYSVWKHSKIDNEAKNLATKEAMQFEADRTGKIIRDFDRGDFYPRKTTKHNSPDNKSMHSYNGNMFGGDVGHETKIKLPGTKVKIPQLPSDKIRVDKQKHLVVQHKENTGKVVSSHLPVVKTSILNPKQQKDYEKWVKGSDEQLKKLNSQLSQPLREAGYRYDHDYNLYKPTPTNKSMHIQNGNIRIKYQRKKHLGKKKVVKKIFKKTILKSKSLPKAVKAAGTIESREKRLAHKYASFLKDPTIPPPRLGSTGLAPTKLVHGYFKATYNMSAPGVGTTPGLTNCVSIFVSTMPKAFQYFSSRTIYSGPVIIAFSNSDNVALNDATNSTLYATNFTNVNSLTNEIGSGTMGRLLGAHVSLECRCPMMSVSPPYAYGGLMPALPAQSSVSSYVDNTQYLTANTNNVNRNLPQSKDEPGYEISSVYAPDMATNLLLNTTCVTADNGGSVLVQPGPTPYIGMTNCPTSAAVTVTVSAWYEILQNSTNATYGGWKLGPKVSAEDVFDNLPRITPVKPKALSQGVRDNIGMHPMMFAPPIVENKDKDRITLLEEKLNRLQLLVDCEDEKYITTSPPDTPTQTVSLSKSTIDLIRDRLTPGSVTSKTTKISQL